MSELIRSANCNFYSHHAGDLWPADPNQLPLRLQARPGTGLLGRLFGMRSARGGRSVVEEVGPRASGAHGFADGL